ncbi:carbohydrate-binding protein [Marinoscillum furvescens]|uniref:Putative secreted protein (Por secretion system target) n=1 Tax=Marinoscillum furvescens DSM 4134 TaxID=1122208 RepID=A0A3D9KYH7_MARFU|nr:carbohydrate-binding domain-containing protein [Marinoscillum furvescens]RED94648.1 putative secreted protein (Por secretion system target) [Marinoscillum furvescens DSM 4134]
MKKHYYFPQGATRQVKPLRFILLAFGLLVAFSSNAQFVHPGISHKLSDLDRMKYMVEAGIEPWATTFQNLSNHGRAKHTYQVNVDPALTTEYNSTSDGWFINDGTAAYYNALMWYITGDSRHADKAIEIFNTWKGLKRNTMSIPLSSGRIWRIIEAAEIIEHTYNGWAASDIQEFKDMLVYPGYSNTTVPTAAINSNDITFYWKVYQGDPARHGNQGLFAMRTMMAMAIFLDNEIMYDRALRYLQGLPHRSDDLAYPSGPPINNSQKTSCEYFDEFTQNGFETTIEDYGFNEVISNYIYENGQCQESSRDQAHGLAGVSTIAVMSEMAWSQGDDLYGHLNNRPLLGLEFYYRYNLSYANSYPDQPTPWEPTVASGEYIERTDRSGRWKSLKINPYLVCDDTRIERGQHNLQPVYEMNLGHYRDRLQLPAADYKWLQRGHDYLTAQIGVEGEGTVTDHPGYGGLKFRRVSPGDPISGFDANGLPIYAMNVLPMTIEAENFDYFATSGEDRVYNDTGAGNNGGAYRTDENVDVEVASEGGYNIGWIDAGEFLTYTVYVPVTGNYDISVKYAAPNSGGQIKVSSDGVDKTGNVALKATGNWQVYTDTVLVQGVTLNQGVQSMRVDMVSGGFNLNSITINNAGGSCASSNLALCGTASQSSTGHGGVAERAIDGNTNGAWSGNSVTHTNSETNPWWEVALDTTYDIGDINIFNRTDGCCKARLSNFTVSVLDGSTTTFSQTFTTFPDPSITVNAGGATGSVVRVQLNDTNPLSLAEVEVYQDPGVVTNTLTIQENTTGFCSVDGTVDSNNAGYTGTGFANTANALGNGVNWEIDGAAGDYTFRWRYASSSDRPADLIVNGVTESSNIAFNSTGSWTTWTSTADVTVTLAAGAKTIRLEGVTSSGLANIDYLEVTGPNAAVVSCSGGARVVSEMKQNSEVKVFPNPVEDHLTLVSPAGMYHKYQVLNIDGKQLLKGNLNVEATELSIDLSTLQSGLYILRLEGGDTSQQLKLIKK